MAIDLASTANRLRIFAAVYSEIVTTMSARRACTPASVG